MEERAIGKVVHYFGKIGVAAIKITANSLKIGDTIHIKGHTTDFIQTVESMQIEKQNITEAKVGDNIGLKVQAQCRENDVVYKVIQP